jgi:peptidoglycan/LPS O-acetylase OafA/YrhL
MTEKRIPSLDGLRAISITLVILSHLVKWHHIKLDMPGAYGTLGVQMFFVLSGFLITSLLLKEQADKGTISLRRFYVRRAFRILPAALVYLIVATLLFWRQMRWMHVAAALFYIANMDSSLPWVLGHLWSLSIEEQFYLIWPLAIKTWFRYRIPVLLAVFGFTPIFHAILYALRVKNGLVGSLPVFADQLAIGCLLAILAPRLPKISKPFAVAMLLAIALTPLYPATSPSRTLFMLFVLRPLVAVSLAGVLLHAIQVPYSFLNWRPITWIGQISYSLYLWQQVFCSNPRLHLGYSLVIPAVACACLSYYFVEKPLLRLRETLNRTISSSNQAELSSQPMAA